MIERTESEGIVTLRLAHGKASVMDIELVDAIALALAEEGAANARAVVLTGTGSIFSAGVDLFRLADGGREYADRFYPALSRMLLDVFAFPRPLVVAINGHAIAGGCILALAGDYRLLAQGNGRMGIPELLVGVPFPPSVLEAVRFVVPPQHLQNLIYTGRTVVPDEALRYGLVDELVAPDVLLARAMEVATQLAAIPSKAFEFAKRQLRDHALSRAKHYAAELDDEVRELWGNPETIAKIREYLAKTVRK
jgi:enoyl-CoA hydratase